MRRALLVGPFVLALGCAALAPVSAPPSAPPPAAQPPVSPGPGTPVGTTASGGSISTSAPAAPAVVDSLPSRAALAVLDSIPEPLAPGERVPSAAPARRPAPTLGAGGEPASTNPVETISSGEDEAGLDDVPVPAPTRVLGDRPRPAAEGARTDSLPAPSEPAATPRPSASAALPPRSVPPDSCWRVQVTAPPERERADALRAAAESQLLVAMVIETEKGLHKVRTRGCLGAAAADSLKRRAVTTGFTGAFRFAGKRP